MSYPSFPGDKIKEIIGDKGKMFVAIDGNRVVGTLALIPGTGVLWYNRGAYGNLCFGAVLPEYSGKGIYRSLYQIVESTARDMGLRVLTRDTNENNARMLKITKQEGYYFVGYKAHNDHCSIIRAKWLFGCPHSLWYIKVHYLYSYILGKIQYNLRLVK